MKLTYYGYCLFDKQEQVCISFDVYKFLSTFCRGASNLLRNSFDYNGEKIFLFRRNPRVFLFAITRDSEIIKKINTSELTVAEIHDMLERNEKLGFASYLYVGKNTLGIASTLFAPRVKAFINFFNNLLKKSGNGRYEIFVEALLHKATKSEAMSFPTVSSATVKIDRDSSWFAKLDGLIHGNDNGLIEVDSFEVKITPKHGGNIANSFRELAARIPDEGIRKFTIRAKSAFDEILTDYYLEGKGILSDFIYSKIETDICDEIKNKVNQNPLLNDKINDFIEREECQNVDIPSITAFNSSHSWSDSTFDIQDD